MARRPYAEGDWFLVPVPWDFTREVTPEPVSGVVLVARGRRGRVAFVYVFGPWGFEPSSSDLELLKPGDALFTCLLWDEPLRDGTFKRLRGGPTFNRDAWPMPWFSIHSGLPGTPSHAVRSSEDEPYKSFESWRISSDFALQLPEWKVGGAAEIYEKLALPDEPTFRISDLA